MDKYKLQADLLRRRRTKNNNSNDDDDNDTAAITVEYVNNINKYEM